LRARSRSAAGGAAGILVGIGISQLVSHVAEWSTLLSPVAIIGGFWFSAGVGIFFGYYAGSAREQREGLR